MNDSNSVQHNDGKNIKSIAISLRLLVIILILILLIVIGILMEISKKKNDVVENNNEKIVSDDEDENRITSLIKETGEAQLQVFVFNEISDSELEDLKKVICQIDGVDSATIYTKEDALIEMKDRLKNNQNLLEDFEGENNVFPNSIIVKISKLQEIENIQDEIYKIKINGKICAEKIVCEE